MVNDYDVIIIGAGQAGCAAAYELSIKHNRSILLLEASDHVGGRTRNYDIANNCYDTATDDAFELGGTWLSPDHTAVLGLCRELGVGVFRASFLGGGEARVREECDDVVEDKDDDEEEEEWPWWFSGPDYYEKEMEEMQKMIMHMHSDNGSLKKVTFQSPKELLGALDPQTRTELNRLGKKINTDASSLGNGNCWESSTVGKDWDQLDAYSTGEALSPSLSTLNGQAILNCAIMNKNADVPKRVSYLYNLISFKGCNSSGPDTEYRVRGGTQAIPLKIAELLNDSSRSNSRVMLNMPVERVRVLNNDSDSPVEQGSTTCPDAKQNTYIEVQTQNGQTFTSKALILTGSPHAIQRINFQPEFPQQQKELLSNMPMGRSVKFAAVYKRGPWWRKWGLQGDILACGLPKELSMKGDSMPIFPYSFDLSPYSKQFGVICCFVEGLTHEYFVSLTKERREELMRLYLRLTFEDLVKESSNENQSLLKESIWEPDEFIFGNWGPDNPYVGGAYTSYFPPGILSQPKYWKAYREVEKLPRVFLAGADYHVGFGNGYIEGAVRSGQRVSNIINDRLKSM